MGSGSLMIYKGYPFIHEKLSSIHFMKILNFLSCIILALPMCTFQLLGQDGFGVNEDSRFEPTTTWPYLYGNFTQGTVLNNKGNTIDYDRLNVNVINGKMHFVKDGKIMEADMGTVYVVRVNEDVYLNCQGKLMKVEKESENGAVVTYREVDRDKMSRANIGYGTSAVASTRNISIVEVEANIGSSGAIPTLNRSLDDATKSIYDGDPLILKYTNYLVVDGLLIPAKKKDVTSDKRFDSGKVESFIKTHKVKWNNTDDLSSLVEFLHTVTKN